MADVDTPLIILLGGASGTGKTTLANALVQELGLAHHVSTGFIREVARAVLPASKARQMGGYSFDAWRLASGPTPSDDHRVIQGALAQTRLLLPAIEACIQRSVREGASLVLEGSHMLPGLFDPTTLGASLFCVLDVPDRDQMVQRALGPTHSSRSLDQEQLASIVEFQDACLCLAREHGVPIVENMDMGQTVARVKELLVAFPSRATPVRLD